MAEDEVKNAVLDFVKEKQELRQDLKDGEIDVDTGETPTFFKQVSVDPLVEGLVEVFADSIVPAGKKLYLSQLRFKESSGAAWTGAGDMELKSGSTNLSGFDSLADFLGFSARGEFTEGTLANLNNGGIILGEFGEEGKGMAFDVATAYSGGDPVDFFVTAFLVNV